jgi:plasmid stabilization system protein ParE
MVAVELFHHHIHIGPAAVQHLGAPLRTAARNLVQVPDCRNNQTVQRDGHGSTSKYFKV